MANQRWSGCAFPLVGAIVERGGAPRSRAKPLTPRLHRFYTPFTPHLHLPSAPGPALKPLAEPRAERGAVLLGLSTWVTALLPLSLQLALPRGASQGAEGKVGRTRAPRPRVKPARPSQAGASRVKQKQVQTRRRPGINQVQNSYKSGENQAQTRCKSGASQAQARRKAARGGGPHLAVGPDHLVNE
jgi:hypothetical protein